MGWTTGIKVLVMVGQEFSLLHAIQTGPGDHPAFFAMGTGCSFLRSKELEHETAYSLKVAPRSRKCGFMHPLPIQFLGIVLY
jgi:hypothetical protein